MVTRVEECLLRGLAEKPLKCWRTHRSSQRNTERTVKGGWDRGLVVIASWRGVCDEWWQDGAQDKAVGQMVWLEMSSKDESKDCKMTTRPRARHEGQ